jgi:hypothetical protein
MNTVPADLLLTPLVSSHGNCLHEKPTETPADSLTAMRLSAPSSTNPKIQTSPGTSGTGTSATGGS